MLYTAECMSKQDCIMIFANSTNSFKIHGAVKNAYKELLNGRGQELIEAVEHMLDSKKMRVTKG